MKSKMLLCIVSLCIGMDIVPAARPTSKKKTRHGQVQKNQHDDYNFIMACQQIVLQDVFNAKTFLKHVKLLPSINKGGLTGGGTILMVAAELGHQEAVRLLLKEGALVDCKDNSNKTVFDYVLFGALKQPEWRENQTIIMKMLAEKTDSHVLGTFVLEAVKTENSNLLRLFHTAGISLDQKVLLDGIEYTPLAFAIHERKNKSLCELIKLGVERTEEIYLPGIGSLKPVAYTAYLASTVFECYPECYKDYLSIINMLCYNKFALDKAWLYANEPEVQMLLKAWSTGQDSIAALWASDIPLDCDFEVKEQEEAKDSTFFDNRVYCAEPVVYGQEQHIQQNNQVMKKQIQKFFLTIEHEKDFKKATDTLLSLLHSGVSINAGLVDGKHSCIVTPLIKAMSCDRPDIVKWLIHMKADLQVSSSNGVTPLLMAFAKNISLVSTLVDAGVSMETPYKGVTLLTMAVKSKDSSMVKMLLDKGARADIFISGKTTLLMYAYDQKVPIDILDLLIRYGASIDAQDDNNETILHVAIRNGDQEMVQLLLSAGASIDKVNIEGKTPLFLSQDMHPVYPAITAIVNRAHSVMQIASTKEHKKRHLDVLLGAAHDGLISGAQAVAHKYAQEEKRQADNQKRIDNVKSAADAERVLRIEQQNLFLKEKEKEEKQARAKNVRLAKRLADEEQARRIKQQDLIVKDIACAERKAKKRAIRAAQQLSEKERLERIADYDRIKLKEQEHLAHVMKVEKQCVREEKASSNQPVPQEVYTSALTFDQALRKAVIDNNHLLAKQYIKRGGNPYAGVPSSIQIALLNGQYDFVHDMLTVFYQIAENKKDLFSAACQGDSVSMGQLLQKSWDQETLLTVVNGVNQEGDTPLLVALNNGHSGCADEVVKKMISAGVDCRLDTVQGTKMIHTLFDLSAQVHIPEDQFYRPSVLQSVLQPRFKNSSAASNAASKLIKSLFSTDKQAPLYIPEGTYSGSELLSMVYFR